MRFRSIGIFISAVTAVVLFAGNAFAACSANLNGYTTGNSGSHFSGTYQNYPSGITNPGIEANITTYDPTVWVNTSAWLMMVDTSNMKHYTQTGWLVEPVYTGSAEWVWVESANSNGYWDVFYDPSANPDWCNATTSPAGTCRGVSPAAGTPQYMVHWAGNGEFFYEYQNTVWFQNTTNLGWGIGNQFQIYGETHAQADQNPGQVSSHVYFNNIQIDNSGWVNANIVPTTNNQSNGTPTWGPATKQWQYTHTANGYSMDIWDSRCN